MKTNVTSFTCALSLALVFSAVGTNAAAVKRKVYKNLDEAVASLSSEGKNVEALKFLLSKTGGSPSSDENFSRADLLEKLGHYQVALSERIQGIQKGKVSNAQLSRAGELALVTDNLEPLVPVAVLLNQGKVPQNSWPAGFRAALTALYFRIGDMQRAVAMAPQASELSSLGEAARVKALHVISAVEFVQGHYDRAAQVLRVAADLKAFNPGLAYLQRSRIFFEQAKYNQSLEELVNIPRNNSAWYPGVLTAAWSAYHMKDYNLALGQLMTLINPYLAGKFNPESWILESNVLYRLCHYQSSLSTLKTLRERYKDLPTAIEKFKRQYGGRYQGVAALMSFARGENVQPGDYNPAQWGYIADGVLSTEAMVDVDRAIVMASNSSAFLKSTLGAHASPGIRASLARFSRVLDAAKREAYRKGLRVMDRRLSDMTNSVNDALEGALAIEVEINTRIRERLILGEVPKMKEIDFEADVNKGYEFWPFQGEFWRDEAGSFVFATSDVCGSDKGGT